MITLFLAIPFVQNSRKHQEKKLSKKKDAMECMCYLLTFIFNQTESQSHQSLNTLTAPRPSPFRRWVSIRGGGPDLVRAMKPRGFHLVFFLRKVYAKSMLMYEIPRFLNDMDIFC